MNRPLRMPDNRVPVYYEGGEGIDRFRAEPGARRGPEDWVASLCRLPASIIGATGSCEAGLSHADSSEALKASIAVEGGWVTYR